MQSESDRNAAVIAHQLSDNSYLEWQQALNGNGMLLRMAAPDQQQLDAIAERFELDDLHIKDLCNPDHPPFLNELDDGAIHLILRFPIDTDAEEDEGVVASASLLIDRRCCVLIWPKQRHLFIDERKLTGLSVSEAVSVIIHFLVDHLLKRVYLLRERLDEIEDECFADVGSADLERLLFMRKDLARMARLAQSNSAVLDRLKLRPHYSDDLHLADAAEHMQRAESIAESKAEHALNVMQAVQSLLSQRLNDVMKFLAVITVILTPMGIIAGIFGMNFTQMEVLSYPGGFAFTIWGMLLLSVLLAVIFKIRKWW